MGELLGQLGQLFLQSAPTIVFVFLLFLILDKLFFRPLTALLQQREEATKGALARAREQAAAAETKAREYEAAFQAARQEVYRQREAARRTSLSEREEMLRKAREHSEAMIKEATAGLAAEVSQARKDLESTARTLAEEVAGSVLGRSTLSGQAGGSAT